MSDSLDSLDKALDAERQAERRHALAQGQPLDATDEESIDTVIGTNAFTPEPPPSPPKPKKIPPQPPMAAKNAEFKHEDHKVEIELGSEELAEIVDRTLPIQRTPELAAQFALAATAFAASKVPPAPTTEPHLARTLPVNAHRPSSIAPVAMDVMEVPGPSKRAHAPVDATQKVRAMPAAPRSSGSSTLLVAGLSAGAVAVAGVLAAFLFTSGSSSGVSASTTTSEARKAEGKGVRTAVIDSPETAPSKTETKSSAGSSAPEANDPPAVPIGAIPSVHASSHASAPRGGGHAPATASRSEPKPEAKPAPAKAEPKPSKTTSNTPAPASSPAAAPAAPPAAAPVDPAPKPTTGTIAVANPNLMTIVIDGEHRRLSGGRVVVQCGAHRVRVGMAESQIVNVPCGGTANL